LRRLARPFTATLLAYVGAALAGIAGCFASWARLRLGRSARWLVPGVASLALFACPLTLMGIDAAGRALADHGGVCVAAPILWLRAAEGGQAAGPMGRARRRGLPRGCRHRPY
jgi:small multidrug resistance family-3 protein